MEIGRRDGANLRVRRLAVVASRCGAAAATALLGVCLRGTASAFLSTGDANEPSCGGQTVLSPGFRPSTGLSRVRACHAAVQRGSCCT